MIGEGEGRWGMKRVAGIEPACLAWEASALPLSYTRGSVGWLFWASPG